MYKYNKYKNRSPDLHKPRTSFTENGYCPAKVITRYNLNV